MAPPQYLPLETKPGQYCCDFKGELRTKISDDLKKKKKSRSWEDVSCHTCAPWRICTAHAPGTICALCTDIVPCICSRMCRWEHEEMGGSGEERSRHTQAMMLQDWPSSPQWGQGYPEGPVIWVGQERAACLAIGQLTRDAHLELQP